MHRTDAEGNVDGRFNPGNPAIGQKATRIDADWLNSVQEEVVHVIEESGGQLDKADTTQLYHAIVALAAGAAGDGSGGVPTTRQIGTSGLATGGGDLAANRTINVAKASAADVAAQTDDAKAVTPLALAGLVGLSIVGGARVLQLGETKIQMFSGTAQGNTTTVLTLPQAFSTENMSAFCNGGAIDNDAQDNFPFVSGRGLTSISLFNARGTSVSVNIIAIGR